MSRLVGFYEALGVPSTKNERTFDTYRFYLDVLLKDLTSNYSTLDNLAKCVWSESKLILPTQDLDEKTIRRFLMIAWNTEYLVGNNVSPEIEIIKVGNLWRPIQAYYAIYSAGEAVSYALDGRLIESHSKCIAKLNSIFVDRIRIKPWCYCYHGNTRKGLKPKNFPANTKTVNNLSRKKGLPIDMIATCIQAEHRNRIEDFEPKKLTSKQKERGEKKLLKLDYDPGYTTVFNFLYRLRIKSNYKDAEIFISDSPDEYVKEFAENLASITNTTLLLFEIIIIRRWGKDRFVRLAQSYLQTSRHNKEKENSRLGRRLKIYDKLKYR